MKNEIIIYQADDLSTRLEVRIEEETIWLTQTQIVSLFNSSKANISEHIKHIFQSHELKKQLTVRKIRTVQIEGNRTVSRKITHYNLDMIISVGYRVKSIIATRFRIWATQLLKEYIIKGFAMDDERLKESGAGAFFHRHGLQNRRPIPPVPAWPEVPSAGSR